MPIELIREGKRQTVTAVVGERPPEDRLAAADGDNDDDGDGVPATGAQPTRDAIGLGLQNLTPEIARQLGIATTTKGVVVTTVDPSSDAAQEGIQRGDIILSINQRPLAGVADASASIDAARRAGRTTVLLFIQRGSTPPRYIGVKLLGR